VKGTVGTIAAILGIVAAFFIGMFVGQQIAAKQHGEMAAGGQLTDAAKKTLIDQMALAIASNSEKMAKDILTEAQNRGVSENALKIVADKARAAAPTGRPMPSQPSEDPNKVYQVEAGNSYAKGPKNAPITVLIFSDFQCPFCGRAEPTLKQLDADYPGKIRFVWKNKILPMHPKAPLAHNAALAAGEQGKFWEMHDKIFTNQQALDRDTLLKYAKELGLNIDKFTKAMDDPNRYKDFIATEDKQAEDAGIRGTPTFLINGKMVRGAQPVENFKKVIDEELAGKKG
jgi:protein-disulfide isomerase